MEDLHTDNSTYIDTPFTLELKAEVKELTEKLRGYIKACKQLKSINDHREEVISLRDITIARLKGEVNTLKEREDSQARQRAYNTWSKSPQAEPSYALRPTREELYDCNP